MAQTGLYHTELGWMLDLSELCNTTVSELAINQTMEYLVTNGYTVERQTGARILILESPESTINPENEIIGHESLDDIYMLCVIRRMK